MKKITESEIRQLPENIRKLLGGQSFTGNDVGMSGAEVYMFPEYVLKIQPHTKETENEYEIIKWLKGRIPVPEIVEYGLRDGKSYTLMTRIWGKMLCEEEILLDSERLIRLSAEGIQKLWSVDIRDCPVTFSRLEERLKAARYNVENHLVDLDNVEEDTFGPDGFKDPRELLEWLEANRPEEDLVLTHGDFCLPNLFADQGGICGYIDLGKMGPADRWQDLAILLRSLDHNMSGYYNGKVYGKFETQMLLDALGTEMNEEKNRYYRLLDELF